MSLEIEGVSYITAAEVAREVGVSRQTLWRWRRDAKIPAGHRFRDRQILFTERQVEEIRNHANKVIPIPNMDEKHLSLS
jgi:transposase-like protein